MTIRSLFILLPIVLSGGILVHLIWPDKGFKSILLKIFLGIGVGLGLNSFLYFLYLLLSRRQVGFIVFQILGLIILVSILLVKEKRVARAVTLQPASVIKRLSDTFRQIGRDFYYF